MEAEETHGRLDSILVTSIIPNGPMAKYFGLQRNDSITEVGTSGVMQKVRDVGDAELAKAFILEAYQRQQPLTVIREGQQLTLPLPKPRAVPGPAAAAPEPKQGDAPQH